MPLNETNELGNASKCTVDRLTQRLSQPVSARTSNTWNRQEKCNRCGCWCSESTPDVTGLMYS